MGKTDVLDRVAADLARRHTTPAIQRLSSLVAAHPTDLDLRRRLADAWRMVGNLIEAGRWRYLQADADPVETAAFERAYPSPARRLRKLRWPVHGQAATDFARGRLAALGAVRAAASTALGAVRAAASTAPPGLRWLPRRTVVVALVVTTPLAALGAFTVLQWLI